MFILTKIFKLSVHELFFLEHVYDYFLENMNKKDLKSLLQIKIDQHFSIEECAICFNKLIKNTTIENYMKLYMCQICHNLVHDNCFRKWISKNENKTCVYCRNKI